MIPFYEPLAPFLVVITAFAQEILHDPEDTAVFTNHSARFRCIINGGFSGWKINGTVYESLPFEIRSDMEILTTSTPEGYTRLEGTIIARDEYNGSRIQCLTQRIGIPSVNSANASLLIQGILSSFGDVNAITSTSSVTVNWTAPFSLDVTGVDHDIWYSVIIYNVTDENNPTVMDCTDCINITDTHYTFTPNYLNPCHVYNFSIIPHNGAGQGKCIGSTTVRKPVLIVQPARYSQEYVSVPLIINVHGIQYNNIVLNGVSAEDVKNITQSAESITYTFLPNKIYPAFFEVFTAIGTFNSSQVILSTYDVQSMEVEERGDGLRVIGELMTDSRATGCMIVLQGSSSSSPDIFRVILRTGTENTVSSTISVLPDTYSLYVYDLEENNLPNSLPAIVMDNISTRSGSFPIMEESLILLSNSSIVIKEDRVYISCEFKENTPRFSSCVVMYRAYFSPSLTALEFLRVINFPVSIEVDDPENYTFALFGKDSSNGIEEHPLFYFKTIRSEPDRERESGEETSISQIEIIAITAGGVIVITGIGGFIIFLVIQRKCHNKKCQSVQQGAVYEEVDLPEKTASSPIVDTTPNTAYATMTWSTRHISSNPQQEHSSGQEPHIII